MRGSAVCRVGAGAAATCFEVTGTNMGSPLSALRAYEART